MDEDGYLAGSRCAVGRFFCALRCVASHRAKKGLAGSSCARISTPTTRKPRVAGAPGLRRKEGAFRPSLRHDSAALDRKSTRLNSSHSQISYAVFCLKKKK